jgi:hypothetical protein
MNAWDSGCVGNMRVTNGERSCARGEIETMQARLDATFLLMC